MKYAFILSLLLMHSLPAAAGIYRCTMGQKIIYSATPCPYTSEKLDIKPQTDAEKARAKESYARVKAEYEKSLARKDDAAEEDVESKKTSSEHKDEIVTKSESNAEREDKPAPPQIIPTKANGLDKIDINNTADIDKIFSELIAAEQNNKDSKE